MLNSSRPSQVFSDKEIALFDALGKSDLVCMDYFQGDPCGLYTTVAKELFLSNATGLAVDSLRRCLQAITDSSIYRKTPEFDSLIDLSEVI